MKKIITIGAFVAIFIGGVALAKVTNISTWYMSDNLKTSYTIYEKTYDEDTNIVCYSAVPKVGHSISISCLKNN